MDTCKYIHYEVDAEDIRRQRRLAANLPIENETSGGDTNRTKSISVLSEAEMTLVPPQWVQCDLRYTLFTTSLRDVFGM
jgi:hypothetical protein